jgi:hypothetical protein
VVQTGLCLEPSRILGLDHPGPLSSETSQPGVIPPLKGFQTSFYRHPGVHQLNPSEIELSSIHSQATLGIPFGERGLINWRLYNHREYFRQLEDIGDSLSFKNQGASLSSSFWYNLQKQKSTSDTLHYLQLGWNLHTGHYSGFGTAIRFRISGYAIGASLNQKTWTESFALWSTYFPESQDQAIKGTWATTETETKLTWSHPFVYQANAFWWLNWSHFKPAKSPNGYVMQSFRDEIDLGLVLEKKLFLKHSLEIGAHARKGRTEGIRQYEEGGQKRFHYLPEHLIHFSANYNVIQIPKHKSELLFGSGIGFNRSTLKANSPQNAANYREEFLNYFRLFDTELLTILASSYQKQYLNNSLVISWNKFEIPLSVQTMAIKNFHIKVESPLSLNFIDYNRSRTYVLDNTFFSDSSHTLYEISQINLYLLNPTLTLGYSPIPKLNINIGISALIPLHIKQVGRYKEEIHAGAQPIISDWMSAIPEHLQSQNIGKPEYSMLTGIGIQSEFEYFW